MIPVMELTLISSSFDKYFCVFDVRNREGDVFQFTTRLHQMYYVRKAMRCTTFYLHETPRPASLRKVFMIHDVLIPQYSLLHLSEKHPIWNTPREHFDRYMLCEELCRPIAVDTASGGVSLSNEIFPPPNSCRDFIKHYMSWGSIINPGDETLLSVAI